MAKGKGWHGDTPGHKIAANKNKYKKVFKNTKRVEFESGNTDAKKVWEALGNIPVDNDGQIEEPFMQFPVGTDREDIWEWIENKFNVSVHDLMFGKVRAASSKDVSISDFKTMFEPVKGTEIIKKTGTGFEVRYISPDQNAENPREWDNMGIFVAFHKNYSLGDKNHGYKSDQFDGWDELKAKIEEDNKVAVILPVYMYDHSGLTVKTTPFGDRWDSGQIGFIFVTEDKVKEEYGNLSEESIDKARKYLLGEIENYDQYLTGDVYHIVKETYDKYKNQLDYDTVGGYFGQKYAEEALKGEF